MAEQFSNNILHSKRNDRGMVMSQYGLEETQRISLCESLDRILTKGAVVAGEVTLSVANIELLYLGLQVVLTSVEKSRELRTAQQTSNHQP